VITKTFPKEEMFSLTDQIQRSSRDIGVNLAEAWQKRRYEPHSAATPKNEKSVICPPSSAFIRPSSSVVRLHLLNR